MLQTCFNVICPSWDFCEGPHSDPQCPQRGLWANEAGNAETDLAAPHQHHPAQSFLDSGGEPRCRGLTGTEFSHQSAACVDVTECAHVPLNPCCSDLHRAEQRCAAALGILQRHCAVLASLLPAVPDRAAAVSGERNRVVR